MKLYEASSPNTVHVGTWITCSQASCIFTEYLETILLVLTGDTNTPQLALAVGKRLKELGDAIESTVTDLIGMFLQNVKVTNSSTISACMSSFSLLFQFLRSKEKDTFKEIGGVLGRILATVSATLQRCETRSCNEFPSRAKIDEKRSPATLVCQNLRLRPHSTVCLGQHSAHTSCSVLSGLVVEDPNQLAFFTGNDTFAPECSVFELFATGSNQPESSGFESQKKTRFWACRSIRSRPHSPVRQGQPSLFAENSMSCHPSAPNCKILVNRVLPRLLIRTSPPQGCPRYYGRFRPRLNY